MSTEGIIQLESGWEEIETTGIKPFIRLIENGERSFFTAAVYVALYDKIFRMCIQRDPYNHSEPIYQRYSNSLEQYLRKTVAPSFNEAKSKYDTHFLKTWAHRWKNQRLVVSGLSKMFMYLDRFYTPNTDGIKSLSEQGYYLYQEAVFNTFKDHARKAILNCIEKERKNEEQDRELLENSVNVFVQMGYEVDSKGLKVYKQDLEAAVVKHAGDFYRTMCALWLDQDSCPNYLKKAEQMLAAEKHRVDAYLHSSSKDPLHKECYKQLLQVQQLQLLKKKTGVIFMLEEDLRDDLSRLYRLYKNDEKDLQPIADLIQVHIQEEGLRIVAQASPQNHDLVTKLINLHERYRLVVEDCFSGHPNFKKALKGAFEEFINKDDRVSRLLASFINDVLTRGVTVNLEKGIEVAQENVVFLYGYISEKDIFERHYQLFLSNRLLNGLCENEHNEKQMISKIKVHSGYQWCNKLEGMFNDMTNSKDLMNEFKRDIQKRGDVDIDVSVCSSAYWPVIKGNGLKLLGSVQKATESFEKFYRNKHNGHKLTWHLDKGRADVLVHFSPKVSRTLVVTTIQMMILLCFNGAKKPLTCKQIFDKIGIQGNSMDHHLISLVHPKVAVLKKKPNNKTLGPDHMFMINKGYESKLLKVPVPLMNPIKKDSEMKKEEDDAIALSRRTQMDAALVRTMKTRKTMNHGVLVGEVTQQLRARFNPKPLMIKKRIEALIEQEYLKRDDEIRGVYHYLA